MSDAKVAAEAKERLLYDGLTKNEYERVANFIVTYASANGWVPEKWMVDEYTKEITKDSKSGKTPQKRIRKA